MKKLSISILAIIFSLGAAFSQPLSDLGIIPVGVTINSVFRLNITSGGNIEFVVNTVNQYTNGIEPSAAYETHFTVDASMNFDVELYADASDFVGVTGNTTLALNSLGYLVSIPGTLDDDNLSNGTTLVVVTDSPEDIIESTVANPNRGDAAQNSFIIAWELATSALRAAVATSPTLLSQNLTSDRYVVNVIIDLQRH